VTLSTPRLLVATAGTLALFLVAACNGDPVYVVAEVGLNGGSCGTGSLADVTLSCSATVGVWARPEGGGDPIDQACTNFGGSSFGQPLKDLRTVVAGLRLEASRGDRVSVEVALFTPSVGADDCVPPDERPEGDRLDILMQGTGASGELEGSRGPVSVLLQCTETPERTASETCRSACADVADDCSRGVPARECRLQRDDCTAGCEDEACRGACTAAYESCLGETTDGACQLELESCEEAGGTFETCEYAYGRCLDDVCTEEEDACAATCPYPGCASFPSR
jgi:hypothetical protein